MTVSVEIRTTSGGGVRSKAAPGEELVHGSVRGKGLHPKLVEVLPPPEAFKASVHYPLLLTNSPFVKQVGCRRGARMRGAGPPCWPSSRRRAS